MIESGDYRDLKVDNIMLLIISVVSGVFQFQARTVPSVITPSTSDPWLALSTIHSEAKGNCLLPAEQSSGQQARFHRVLENLD